MKVIQINNFYNEGSTGKIVYDIKSELDKRHIDNIVCYGRGKDNNDSGVIRLGSNFYSKICKLFSCINGLMYGGCYYSTYKLFKLIQSEKPDIVHLHCINGNFVNIYKLITFLKNKGIDTIITLHAEFLYTANCGYALDCDKWKNGCGSCPRLKKETQSFFFDRTHDSWIKLLNAYKGFDDSLYLVSVSPWLYSRAEESILLSNYNHRVILNGINTNVFRYKNHILKSKYNIPQDKKMVLHVTASFSRAIKGGKYVIEMAKRIPEVVFVIVGNDNHNMEFPPNVIDIGVVFDQDKLSEFYSMADVLLVTSERETFCMPVAESLSCGTPVVGFQAGAPEEIALKEYSEFVRYGQINELEKALREWLNKISDKEIISQIAQNKYSKERMSLEYITLYEEIYNKTR